MAGAQLFALFGPEQVGLAGEGLAHRIATVAIHDMDGGGLQVAGGIDHVGQHRAAGNRLQHLGQVGFHALASAGGEDDDVQGLGHGAACVGGSGCDSRTQTVNMLRFRTGIAVP